MPIRAFSALLMAGLIWIETGWDGARGGMMLVGILCSLMATFPRPLLAAQSYARGFGLALVVSALYQFMFVPMISNFEMLALLLAPLLYAVAVGLASPATTGTGIGLGLTTFLLLGPLNVGIGQNTAIQWFEFAGRLYLRDRAGVECLRADLSVQAGFAHAPAVTKRTASRCTPC